MSRGKNAKRILRDEGLFTLLQKSLIYYTIERRPLLDIGRKVSKLYHQKMICYPYLGYWPHIREPRTFNEKILYRMLYGQDEFYTVAFDKLTCREYVAELIGEYILPELYYVTVDPSDIPFGTLPDKYVVKSNVQSGEILLSEDVDHLSEEELVDKLESWKKTKKELYLQECSKKGKYYYDLDNVKQKIMVEERLKGTKQSVPLDYKFYVFHGSVEYVHVDFNRFGDRQMRFFDRDWEPQEFIKGHNKLGPVIERPQRYDEMVEISEMLGKQFDFIRVDLFHTEGNRIVFGELTPGPGRGRSPFNPMKVDFEFGELW